MRQAHWVTREKEETMSELNLQDVISEALNEIEPSYLDNSTEGQDEDLVDLDLPEDDVDGDPDTQDESEIDEDDELDEELSEEAEEDVETDEEDDFESDSFVVKVDGEEFSVTLNELKAGYSRQAHFTRSMQALKEEREAFETEISQYSDTLGQLSALDEAWESNPVSVMTSLLGSTENPSYYLGLIIKEAAANDLLTPEALQYFGIDEDTKRGWSTETEIERLRREIQEREAAEHRRSQENEVQASEARVQEAIRMFDNQISEIIAIEGLDFPTTKERAEFKADVLRYANDNNILDLHKAYAALAYEQSREAKASGKRRAASHDKKSATRVVSRRSAGGSGVTKVDNSTDLRSVIQSTMRDLEF
jgi:hypothetical protein